MALNSVAICCSINKNTHGQTRLIKGSMSCTKCVVKSSQVNSLLSGTKASVFLCKIGTFRINVTAVARVVPTAEDRLNTCERPIKYPILALRYGIICYGLFQLDIQALLSFHSKFVYFSTFYFSKAQELAFLHAS